MEFDSVETSSEFPRLFTGPTPRDGLHPVWMTPA
jgi:hypothetical protein